MTNYKIISFREGTNKTHLYFEHEKSLYRKWGSSLVRNDKVQYYCCIEKKCSCRGKIINSKFVRTKRPGETSYPVHTNHFDNHEEQAETEMAYEDLKKEVLRSSRPVRDIHREKVKE
jgi:hypothetical protein